MYRQTSSQIGLWASELRLDPGLVKKMDASWAGMFRRNVWPVLLRIESEFGVLYSEEGRPAYSVARKLGVMLLRELKGLKSDEHALECLQYNLLWQYALGISHPDDAGLTRRSLGDFRSRIARHALQQAEEGISPDQSLLARMFTAVGQQAIESLGLSMAEQRVDSTFVQSNMKHRGRQALMRDSIRGLMSQLENAGKLADVPADLYAWYQKSPDWERSHCTVEQTIQWMRQLLECFAEDGDIGQSEPYLLLKRIFREQVTTTDATEEGRTEKGNEGPVAETASADELREPPQSTVPADPAEEESQSQEAAPTVMAPVVGDGEDQDAPDESSLVMRDKSAPDAITSTTDPDARRGPKGTGYLVHIAETCGNEESCEIITDLTVVPANTSDKTQLVGTMDRLDDKGMAPTTIYADGGYYTPDNLEEADSRGIVLHMPVNRSGMSEDAFSRSDFQFDDEGNVTACPRGHLPVLHQNRKSSAARTSDRHAVFDRNTCDACPDKSRCPVQTPSSKTGNCFLAISRKLRLRDEAWEKQKSEDWQRNYCMRGGVEASNSELKRGHNARRLTVRGIIRVYSEMLVKGTACNIKRWLRRALSLAALLGRLQPLLRLLCRPQTPANANYLPLAA